MVTIKQGKKNYFRHFEKLSTKQREQGQIPRMQLALKPCGALSTLQSGQVGLWDGALVRPGHFLVDSVAIHTVGFVFGPMLYTEGAWPAEEAPPRGLSPRSTPSLGPHNLINVTLWGIKGK